MSAQSSASQSSDVARLHAMLKRAVVKLLVLKEKVRRYMCRVFRYHMSENRALRQVAKYYASKGLHPVDERSVPVKLLEAFARLGRESFIKAKEIGEATRDGVLLSDEQKQFAKSFFVSVNPDGLPTGRDHAEYRHYRTSRTGPLYGITVMPARA